MHNWRYAQLGRKQEALAALDKALELDPSYEPAMLNRLAVEKLEEGEKLPHANFASIEYYKDFPMQKQSLLAHAAGKVAGLLERKG